MKPFRNIRVLPVVLVAVFGLAVLKIAGLVLEGGYVFDYRSDPTKPSWAQENINFPGRSNAEVSDITGSVEKQKEKPKEEAKPDVAKAETTTQSEPAQPVSASERAILERLQARRQELETRAREIDIRESLLKAAEKRAEGRVEEMKAIEARITGAAQQKADEEAARFKGIITMYEGMKPKDAAKVFDRLEMPVLFEIASHIAPRKMADILGQMSPDVAERLTVEMARRAGGDKSGSDADLPKIEGKVVPPPKPN
ncbi:MotE family protein [Bradyrhizobium sp.]|uniref:MotE family protein n=1 Tax=Bradyrhizobium sp. TaxID=376 RepID=UPI00239C49B1|nr:flagellar protein FlbB [Bradyrhizobium sp.]MDE1935906.1 flagellar protein FlbB [Bradyrhizobium sp.]